MKKLEVWKFGIQVTFSAIMIGLCAYELVSDRTKDNQALYWGGLTGVVGYWLPSPTSSKDDERFLMSSQYSVNQTSSNGTVERSQTNQSALAVAKTDN